MKDIIKRILKEETYKTPLLNYYKKVAKMIVDNDIEVDHKNRLIYFPFSGGYSRRESFDGGLTDYVQKRKNEHEDLIGIDFPTYVDQMYGLDVSDKRGILMVIMKLIKKHLYNKVSSEIKGKLNESVDGKFIRSAAKNIISQMEFDEEGSVTNVPWPHIRQSRRIGIYWLYSKLLGWVMNNYQVNDYIAVLIIDEISDLTDIQF